MPFLHILTSCNLTIINLTFVIIFSKNFLKWRLFQKGNKIDNWHFRINLKELQGNYMTRDKKNAICRIFKEKNQSRKRFELADFLTASKYCWSGLKIVFVVVVIVALVIKFLSNLSAFVKVWRGQQTYFIQWKNILEFIKIEFPRLKYILMVLFHIFRSSRNMLVFYKALDLLYVDKVW